MHYLLTPNSIIFNAIIASSYPDDLSTTAALMLIVLNNICIKTSPQLSIKDIQKKPQYVYILIAISRFKEVNYMSKAFQTETY